MVFMEGEAGNTRVMTFGFMVVLLIFAVKGYSGLRPVMIELGCRSR